MKDDLIPEVEPLIKAYYHRDVHDVASGINDLHLGRTSFDNKGKTVGTVLHSTDPGKHRAEVAQQLQDRGYEVEGRPEDGDNAIVARKDGTTLNLNFDPVSAKGGKHVGLFHKLVSRSGKYHGSRDVEDDGISYAEHMGSHTNPARAARALKRRLGGSAEMFSGEEIGHPDAHVVEYTGRIGQSPQRFIIKKDTGPEGDATPAGKLAQQMVSSKGGVLERGKLMGQQALQGGRDVVGAVRDYGQRKIAEATDWGKRTAAEMNAGRLERQAGKQEAKAAATEAGAERSLQRRARVAGVISKLATGVANYANRTAANMTAGAIQGTEQAGQVASGLRVSADQKLRQAEKTRASVAKSLFDLSQSLAVDYLTHGHDGAEYGILFRLDGEEFRTTGVEGLTRLCPIGKSAFYLVNDCDGATYGLVAPDDEMQIVADENALQIENFRSAITKSLHQDVSSEDLAEDIESLGYTPQIAKSLTRQILGETALDERLHKSISRLTELRR